MRIFFPKTFTEVARVKILVGNLSTLASGVLSKSQEDAFTFQVKQPKTAEAPTKRNVFIATLSHQLQQLSFSVKAKMLTQENLTAGLDWDDTLPDNLQAKRNFG